MQSSCTRNVAVGMGIVAGGVLGTPARAQNGVMVERLVGGSMLTQEVCPPPCTCPARTVSGPLVGRLTLVPSAPTPWFTRYTVAASFRATVDGAEVELTGSGTYSLGGDFALTHQLVLDLRDAGPPRRFDSGVVVASNHGAPNLNINARTDVIDCVRTTLTVVAQPGCAADDDDGTGRGVPDGAVTIDDLLYYVALYAAGDARADLDDGSGTGAPDGGIDIADLLYFLAHYAAGC